MMLNDRDGESTQSAESPDLAGLYSRLWEEGDRPELDAFLAAHGPLEPARLAGLLRVDQRRRWQAGDRVPAEDYLARHPAVRDDPELAVDLIFNEFLIRERLGERPDLDEWLRRFPEHAPVLEEQIRLHDAVMGAMGGAAPDGTVTREGTTDAAGAGPPEPMPEEVGNYLVLRVVGRGGMGVVYQAWHRRLNRLAALKMVLGGVHAGPHEVARFRNEAEAVARLHHPNIVQVYDVGEDRGHWYLALEFVDGESLARHLSGTPLPARRAAEIALTLAQAVSYAHERGIVHRDLTPSNVLLTRDGVPKITDFGLAKLLVGGGAGHTQTGAVLGTPSYMSPEQASGRARHVGPAADVYSLGAVLYEMLTGRPPFRAETPLETVLQVARQEPVPPRVLQPHLPRDLETICLTCLHKEPGRRYATAAALAEDLRRFLAGEPITARPVGRAERGWRWARRNPAVAGLAAAMAGVLLAVALGSVVLAVVFDAQRRDAEAARSDALASQARSRLREAEALVGKASGLRQSRRPGQRFEALAALRRAADIGRELGQPPAWFDAVRNEAVAALALPDLHVTQTAAADAPVLNRCDLADDFSLAVVETERGAAVWRPGELAPLAVLPRVDDQVEALAFPGGLFGVRGVNNLSFRLFELRGGEPVVRLTAENVTYAHARPDGRLIALLHADGSVSVWDVASGAAVGQLSPGQVRVAPQIVLHPTEPFVVTSSYGHPTFELRDYRTGQTVVVDPPWALGMGTPAWSPDGRVLAMPSGETAQTLLYAFDPAGPGLTPRRAITTPSGAAAVTFNPAGDRLVVHGWWNEVMLYDLHTGRLIFSTRVAVAGGFHRPLRFDRTGTRLGPARVDLVRFGIWSVADAREYRVVVPSRPRRHEQIRPPVVHPAGLAAQTFPDGVSYYDLARGVEIGFTPVAKGPNASGPALAMDGGGRLYVNSFAGLTRWPLREHPRQPGQWFLGPPERLPFRPGNNPPAVSRDGRVVAQPMWSGYGMAEFAGGWILHPNQPTPRWVDRGESYAHANVSPDGRWAVFGGSVFDAATGEPVWRTPSYAFCAFSPDGRWLLTSHDGGRVVEVGSWRPGPRLGDGTPFGVSPDNSLAVMGLPEGAYRLVELATGRELVRLDDPEQINGPAVFTPDGEKLVVAAKDGLRLWDLRLVRERLRELELDWDAPPYPERPAPPAAPPLRLAVIDGPLGNLLKSLEDGPRRDPQ